VPDAPLRLAVLVSGSGSNLQALLEAIAADPGFRGEIVVVGSDRAAAHGLERARAAGIATVAVAVTDFDDRGAWERALVAELQQHRPEAIVLAGFMRLVTDGFLAQWPDAVINTHPSLLPAFRGAHAVREALAYGVKVTGSTVHFVDAEVDHGPVIAQRAVDIHDGDDEDTLHARIKAVEHQLLPHCVKLLCQGRLRIDGRHVHVSEGGESRPTERHDPTGRPSHRGAPRE
jgi:phosphoribosylglycinamide formyltransferase-1